jgi:hypothetical protein
MQCFAGKCRQLEQRTKHLIKASADSGADRSLALCIPKRTIIRPYNSCFLRFQWRWRLTAPSSSEWPLKKVRYFSLTCVTGGQWDVYMLMTCPKSLTMEAVWSHGHGWGHILIFGSAVCVRVLCTPCRDRSAAGWGGASVIDGVPPEGGWARRSLSAEETLAGDSAAGQEVLACSSPPAARCACLINQLKLIANVLLVVFFGHNRRRKAKRRRGHSWRNRNLSCFTVKW